jgi:hypothetical protein
VPLGTVIFDASTSYGRDSVIPVAALA